MDLIAYTLREEFAGTVEQETDEGVVTVPVYSGGLIRAGDADVNIADELEAGGGTIVVDERNAGAIVHLDEYPPLKRTTVPDGAVATGAFAVAGPYDERTVTELRGDASTRGLGGASRAPREDLVDALNEHDARLADGNLDELGAPLTVARLAQAARGEDVEPAPAPAPPNAGEQPAVQGD